VGFAQMAVVPCKAAEHGCAGEDLIGIVLVVILSAGAVMGVLAWISFRWQRGPLWLVMRLFGGRRRR
jgi:hypothetical protein